MNQMVLTKEQACRFLLAQQGLWPPYSLTGKQGVIDFIRRVGCIQFDPLNIVGRNPELVLQSRVAGFQPNLLDGLLYQDRSLLDGWDKMMSIYLTEDWPRFERLRSEARSRLGSPEQPVTAFLPQIRQAITEKGPVSSLDLEFNQTVDWPWAPTRLSRAALESMYFWGELIIHHKVHTRKIYDFAHHYLPEELLAAPDPNVTGEEYLDWRIWRRIGGIGLVWNKAGDAWVGLGIKSKERDASIKRLINGGQLQEVKVEDVATPFYFRSCDQASLEKALHLQAPLPQAAILAPLDNLLWDRRLVQELFNFEYRWEVYKPVSERKYGYYVLPVIYGDKFVARFEPGRDKKTGALVIKNWWWEPGINVSDEIIASISECFLRFQAYLGVNSGTVLELNYSICDK